MAESALLDRRRTSAPGTGRPRPAEVAEGRGSRGILVSLAALLTTLLAAGGVGNLVEDSGWWLLAAFIGFLAIGAAALVRLNRTVGWAGPIAAVVVAAEGLALTFAGDTLILGLVPTPDTATRMGALLDEAARHIQSVGIPAPQNTGLDFLLVLGLLAGVVFVDALAVTVRAPLIAAVPVLALAVVPGRVLSRPGDVVSLVLVLGGLLLILWLDRRRDASEGGAAAAAAVAALAIVVGLLGQTAAPGFRDDQPTSSSLQPVFTTGADPLVRLGDHLRRGADVPVMTYRTDSEAPVYLRVVTIEDLSGEEWRTAPLEDTVPGDRALDAFPAPAGLDDDVARTVVTTTVDDLAATRRWLPVPYPAVDIEGLADDSGWAWQPDTLTVGGREGVQATGDYTVRSLDVQPTVEQLRAAEGSSFPADAPERALPASLPTIIASTAQEVVAEAGATTRYDRAVALQDYLRSSAFRYDEDTPEVADGDGDSFDVIATFLVDREGYCVHFASAMAVMARTLDIPARIAVGYQPGTRQVGQDGLYEVTSHDLHAWPELYFEGVGWTRFEPTPGRGDVPSFDSAAPTPSTPSEQAAPAPAPSASTPAQVQEEREAAAAAQSGARIPPAVGGALLALAVLAVLALPAVFRRERRRRRLARAADDPSDAWQELHDTAVDLRVASSELSPRSLSAALAVILGPETSSALTPWREAAERARYAASRGTAVPVSAGVALRRAIRDLDRSQPVTRRIFAVLLPASLLPGPRRSSEPTADRS